MSEAEYARIPETLTLREVRFHVAVPGRRTETLTVITTLTDPDVFSKEDIAALYGFRWNVELDIRSIKQTLGLDHPGAPGLQDARHGASGVVGHAAGVQSDPHGNRHGRRRSWEAAASSGFCLGLPDDSFAAQDMLGILDVEVDGVVFRRRGDVRHDAGPHRRQRGRQSSRTHRTSRPETTETPLPAHATPPR